MLKRWANASRTDASQAVARERLRASARVIDQDAFPVTLGPHVCRCHRAVAVAPPAAVRDFGRMGSGSADLPHPALSRRRVHQSEIFWIGCSFVVGYARCGPLWGD